MWLGSQKCQRGSQRGSQRNTSLAHCLGIKCVEDEESRCHLAMLGILWLPLGHFWLQSHLYAMSYRCLLLQVHFYFSINFNLYYFLCYTMGLHFGLSELLREGSRGTHLPWACQGTQGVVGKGVKGSCIWAWWVNEHFSLLLHYRHGMVSECHPRIGRVLLSGPPGKNKRKKEN